MKTQHLLFRLLSFSHYAILHGHRTCAPHEEAPDIHFPCRRNNDPQGENYKFDPICMDVSLAGDVLIGSASSVIRLDTSGSHIREIPSKLPAEIREIFSLEMCFSNREKVAI
jgi:hypothetical protein